MRALAIAATGMSAQQARVEVISNNISNMNTTGYNARRAEFSDLHYQQLARAGVVPGQRPPARGDVEVPSLLRRRLPDRGALRERATGEHPRCGRHASATPGVALPSRRVGPAADLR